MSREVGGRSLIVGLSDEWWWLWEMSVGGGGVEGGGMSGVSVVVWRI